jgi:hypothetical protein
MATCFETEKVQLVSRACEKGGEIRIIVMSCADGGFAVKIMWHERRSILRNAKFLILA